tara:strand:- start:6838 stop:7533 length:696 start_codon:yes stop_codon:yes gene_type:complete
MPLTFGKQGNFPAPEGAMGDGIFIDEVKIVEVIDRSGSKKATGQTWTNDCQIEVKCVMLKNDWDKTLNIGGNFKVEKVPATNELGLPIEDEDGNPIYEDDFNWGSAFKVKNFFEACNLLSSDFLKTEAEIQETLNQFTQGNISPVLLEGAKNKIVKVLSYKKTDGKTKTWNQVAHPKRDNQKWKDYFLSQVDKEYVKDYSPDAQSSGPKKNGASALNLDFADSSDNELTEF